MDLSKHDERPNTKSSIETVFSGTENTLSMDYMMPNQGYLME